MHSLRVIRVIWLRDVLRFWRDRVRIVSSLAQPLLWLVVFGSGLSPAMQLGSMGSTGSETFNYSQFMFPGVVGMIVLFTSVFSALATAWDREFGFLKEVLVAPVSRLVVAIGKMLGGATVAMLQGMLILIFAPLLGIVLTPLVTLQLLGVMFLLAFALTSMGIAVAARVRTMEGFQVVTQFLMMPMFMLSGAVFPLRNLPEWMDVLVRINPVTYGVDPLRQIALRETLPPGVIASFALHPILVDVAVVLAFGVGMMVLAAWSFANQD